MISIKKGQTWSIDAIFAAVVFLIVIVFAIVLLTDLFEAGTTKELNEESQRILQKLSSGIGPQLIRGSEVNMENVEQLLNMTYDELKELLGVKYDFCIFFEDQDGNIILINESFVGFGDPNVTINDLPCGPGGTVCINMTDADEDNFSGTVGCGAFDCDDNNDSIYPRSNESNDWLNPECYDGKDNDCDGLIDRQDPDCCIDLDGDGYSPIPGCSPLIDCVDNETAARALYDPDLAPIDGWNDCPDNEDDCDYSLNAQCPICIHPLAPDPCGDDIDSNCMLATERCLGWDFNCTAEIGGCTDGRVPLFKLSEISNAHTALYGVGPYTTHICCKSTDPDNVMLEGDGSDNDYYVMSFSNGTNAHAEEYRRTIKDISGDGSDGALTGGGLLDTDANPGGFNYTYVDLDASVSPPKFGVTGSNPLIIRAQEYIHLDNRVIIVSGDDGKDAACVVGIPIDGEGGLGRAGGGQGGNGGNQNSMYCTSDLGGVNANLGFGIGSGAGGLFYDDDIDCDTSEDDTDTEGGAGGSYASRGNNGDCGPRNSCTTESEAGDLYSNQILGSKYGRMPLLGGSGGGGGASDYNRDANYLNGAGGGAGGGAIILIAPEIRITNGGGIYADGGDGGDISSPCPSSNRPVSASGGGGSGGTIYLIAERVINEGTISVEGGIGGTNVGTGGDGADGGDGRVRIDVLEYFAPVSSGSSMTKVKEVSITGSGTLLTDYQVLVDVDYEPDMQDDFDDLRFKDAGDNDLDYWIESYIDAISARVWVEVSTISATGETIYMHYGDASAVSASDGPATFIFFDDFETYNSLGDMTSAGWTDISLNAGEMQLSFLGGVGGSKALQLDEDAGTGWMRAEAYYSGQQFSKGVVLEWDWYEDDDDFFSGVNGFNDDVFISSGCDSDQGSNGVFVDGICAAIFQDRFRTESDDVGGESAVGFIRTGWKHAAIVWDDTSEFILDGVTQATRTTNIPSVPLWLHFSEFPQLAPDVGPYGRYDNIFIRKHTASEPISSIGIESVAVSGSGGDGCGDSSNPLPEWSKKKPIAISGASVAQTDYQVRFIIAYDSNMLSDFSDLRFLDADNNQLDYWIESYTSSASATIWLDVPSIPTTGTSVDMYYGNPGAPSVSDVNSVGFEFFDDFSGMHPRSDYTEQDNGISAGSSNWVLQTGSKRIRQYSNIFNGNFGSALLTGVNIDNFEARIRTREYDNDIIGLVFSYQDSSSFYSYQYSNHYCGAYRSIQKDQTCLSLFPAASLASDTNPPGTSSTVSLMVRRYGSTIEAYQNGAQILTADDITHGAGDIGLMTNGDQYGMFYGPFIIRKFDSLDPSALVGLEISTSETDCDEYSGNDPVVGDGTFYFGQHFYQDHISFDIQNPDDVEGINCSYTEGGCDEDLGQICVASISDRTDAHITACEHSEAYDDSICCTMITTCVC